MDTYRVGLLGVGPRGLSQARAYMLHPRTELVALSDIDTKRLATAAGWSGPIPSTERCWIAKIWTSLTFPRERISMRR